MFRNSCTKTSDSTLSNILQVLLVAGDVTSEDDCENVVKKTVEHFHRLDILVRYF